MDNLAGAKDMIKAFDKEWQAKQDIIAATDYEIEKIVDERVYRNKMCYLVRWRNFKFWFKNLVKRIILNLLE